MSLTFLYMQGRNQAYTPYTKCRGPGDLEGPQGGPEHLQGGSGDPQGGLGAMGGSQEVEKGWGRPAMAPSAFVNKVW